MPSQADDLEAAAKLLMSPSTTTTTLNSTANSNSNNNFSNNGNNNFCASANSNSNNSNAGHRDHQAAIRLNNLNKKYSSKPDQAAAGETVLLVDARMAGDQQVPSIAAKKDNGNKLTTTTTAAGTTRRKGGDESLEEGENDEDDDNSKYNISNNNNNNNTNTNTNTNMSGLELQLQEQANKKEPTVIVSLKLLAIFSTLYFFMWSSSLLSQAFNLASYHYAGHFIRTSGFLQNPLIGLMVGVITTVVFQSSGAVTSVLVTIVGSGVLTVRQSIPIIMGANLGTSVTNTVVSLIVYRKKQNFEIAMTAGIVHDMYNMMSVVFMLPIELLFHPLERLSSWMLGLFGHTTGGAGSRAAEIGQVQFLSHLVKPLVDLIIVIDKEKTANLDPNVIVPSNVSLVRRCCNEQPVGTERVCLELCVSLFSYLEFSDNVVCILLLIMAMATLFTCLIFVIKLTKSLLGGKLLNWVANLARREYKFPYSMFVGYLFILVGLIITVLLHSSGVFTSMLVPLAGGDVLNLMQIYELTLGSNVGTTTTGIFAALSAQSKYPIETLQVALCHFIFNVAGILMFYSFPHTTLPIWASQKFGMYSAQNIWFSIVYLIIVFLVAPAVTMSIYLLTTQAN